MGIYKIYVELVRPFTLLAPVSGVIAGGIIASRNFPDVKVIIGACAGMFLNAASNVINQYFDYEADAINKPQRPIPSKRILRSQALIFAITLYIVSFSLAGSVGLRFFLLIICGSLFTFFYSAPPLRSKKKPFLNNLAIAFPRGAGVILAGWSIKKTIFTWEPWFIGFMFTLYLWGAVTTKDFNDIAGDECEGVKTLPVLYGREKTIKLIAPFFYIPFFMIPLGILWNILPVSVFPLLLLSVWGRYVVYLIRKYPCRVAGNENHISWWHMYCILITGHIGLSIAYLVSL
ncbi:MAG: UbiA family prenyltransferase [Candidatus Omnitrophica bacterium]|nr:UbiA family prenyltransferase [Candidatus Omnitrophota bacterium]